jgi:hypothetical protein
MHPIGPVSLEADESGRLPRLGRIIVDMRSRERDAEQLAGLPERNPAWTDDACWPHEDEASRVAIAPEELIHDRAVLLVGEVGEFGPYLVGGLSRAGQHRMTSTPFEVPAEDEAKLDAELQRLLARMGLR